MSRRENQNKLPDAKDKRIAELEQHLAQALATIEKLEKQVQLL